MILCYEVGRETTNGMPHVDLQPLAELREAYESMASMMAPSKVIGVAMNSRLLSAEAPKQNAIEFKRVWTPCV